VLAVLLAASCTPRTAEATVVVDMSFAAQSTGAARIFVGTVQSVESRWNPRAPKYLETLVRFAVEDVVAGDVPSTVTLRFSGGRLGTVEHVIDAMPVFAVGERYVVMAERDQEPPLVSPIVGFNQGLYRVVDDAGAPVVRDRNGSVLGAGTAGVARAAGEPTLDAFLAAVRAERIR
jgi:hypothetical protein